MKLFNIFKKKKTGKCQTESINSKSTTDKIPELIIVMGGVCSGKTTLRKNNYSSNEYTHIDAGEIFIHLSNGEYYDFPSHLEEKINHIGLEMFRKSIFNKTNIVFEIIGDNYEEVKNLVELSKRLNYNVKIDYVECEMEEALQRNLKRLDDNISAHYCEPYHIYWFKKVASEYLNQ